MAIQTIGITGGIGSGKSVVSQILRTCGFTVYDCDSNAKAIMDRDPEIHRKLAEMIDPSTINVDGSINRPRLAQIVFGDKKKLAILNAIVHGAVTDDVQACARLTPGLFFVESAILYSSSLWKYVDRIWEVTADIETRISRVTARDNATRQQVLQRIHSQNNETAPYGCSITPEVIHNDDNSPLLPQIWAICPIDTKR